MLSLGPYNPSHSSFLLSPFNRSLQLHVLSIQIRVRRAGFVESGCITCILRTEFREKEIESKCDRQLLRRKYDISSRRVFFSFSLLCEKENKNRANNLKLGRIQTKRNSKKVRSLFHQNIFHRVSLTRSTTFRIIHLTPDSSNFWKRSKNRSIRGANENKNKI